jgi:hypothetical protein
MDKSLYPENWNAIARAVKDEANWHCEGCGKPCRRPGVDWADFVLELLNSGGCGGWYSQTFEEVVDIAGLGGVVEKPQRFTLTVAHLDHTPPNCDRANLKALCAPCHCRYDLKAMPQKKRLKAERQGQLTIFAGVNHE